MVVSVTVIFDRPFWVSKSISFREKSQSHEVFEVPIEKPLPVPGQKINHRRLKLVGFGTQLGNDLLDKPVLNQFTGIGGRCFHSLRQKQDPSI